MSEIQDDLLGGSDRPRTASAEWHKLREKIIENDSGECHVCGSSENLHVHHIHAVENGGTNGIENLVTVCKTCHYKLHSVGPNDDGLYPPNMSLDVSDSTVDRALALADQLAETGVLAPKQAKVYALREVYGVGRSATADVLELSPNTVDNHLAAARENVQGARDLLELLESSRE